MIPSAVSQIYLGSFITCNETQNSYIFHAKCTDNSRTVCINDPVNEIIMDVKFIQTLTIHSFHRIKHCTFSIWLYRQSEIGKRNHTMRIKQCRH